MNKTYYIFRHGETFATKKGNGIYWLKIFSAPILEEGKPSLLKLAKYLKNVPSDFNVASPFLRCQQTAELVTSITGKKFDSDARIREYTLELPWRFKRRVLHFMQDMEKSEYQHIVICTHSIVIEMLVQYLLKGKIHLRERIISPLPGVLTIVANKKSEVINFNEV